MIINVYIHVYILAMVLDELTDKLTDRQLITSCIMMTLLIIGCYKETEI